MEILLAIATILGGITALWFFWDKISNRWFSGKDTDPRLTNSEKERSHIDLSALDSITFRYASRGDIEKIIQLDKASFDESEIIGTQIFSDWHEKNPKVFSCLAQGDEVIGYFSILPLRSDTLKRFVAGEISEKDFTSTDILTSKEAAKQCADLYFFSIVIARNHSKLLRSMFEEIAREFHRYKSGKLFHRIYVTAATKVGRRLIKRFKFTLVQEAKYRIDGHDLFVKQISRIKDSRDYMKSQLDR